MSVQCRECGHDAIDHAQDGCGKCTCSEGLKFEPGPPGLEALKALYDVGHCAESYVEVHNDKFGALAFRHLCEAVERLKKTGMLKR